MENVGGTGGMSMMTWIWGVLRPSCGFVLPRVSSGTVKVREFVKAPQAEFWVAVPMDIKQNDWLRWVNLLNEFIDFGIAYAYDQTYWNSMLQQPREAPRPSALDSGVSICNVVVADLLFLHATILSLLLFMGSSKKGEQTRHWISRQSIN